MNPIISLIIAFLLIGCSTQSPQLTNEQKIESSKNNIQSISTQLSTLSIQQSSLKLYNLSIPNECNTYYEENGKILTQTKGLIFSYNNELSTLINLKNESSDCRTAQSLFNLASINMFDTSIEEYKTIQSNCDDLFSKTNEVLHSIDLITNSTKVYSNTFVYMQKDCQILYSMGVISG